jgi:hypothetical protein
MAQAPIRANFPWYADMRSAHAQTVSTSRGVAISHNQRNGALHHAHDSTDEIIIMNNPKATD